MIGKLAPVAGATPGKPEDKQRAKLVEAAKAFEAVFVRQMIGSMRQAKLADDIFGSPSTDQFREMQDAQFADEMANKGGLGVAEMLIKQFDKQVGK
ncbi:rod-binding protein [Sphingoaurantiacus capsulatus]|uniref:Rod-binding protein n=1 Tax=Sphingoaurantiacus capsulatus TaxID=1771310 RepID=A0ABV7XD95_9SPHN